MRLNSLITCVCLALASCATPAPESTYNLGVQAYQAKDFAKAREQWANAAAEGNVSAKNNLAYLCYYGLGGEKDNRRAVALWMEAATKGHSEAQWHLGQSFEDGALAAPDLVEAYAWYRTSVLSAEAGVGQDKDVEAEIAQGARKSLASVLNKLPPNQLPAAEARAKELIRMYAKRKAEA